MKACRLWVSPVLVGLLACEARIPIGDLGDASLDHVATTAGGGGGEAGSGGTSGVPTSGSGGAGGDPGSGGATTGTGGSGGSGAAGGQGGAGGATTGTGGAGGSTTGTGGAGGATTGTGGAGGSTTGTGGVGGATTGTGGAGAASGGGNGGATADAGGASIGDARGVPTDTRCAAEAIHVEPRQVDLYVMIDSSGSMDMIDTGQTLSRWDNLAQAIPTFVNDPANAGVEVGVDFFPEVVLDGGIQTSCNVADYTMANVPLNFLPGTNNGHANAIVTAVQGRARSGGTPTVPALSGALQAAKAWQMNNPSRSLSVLFLTDGQPTGCTGNTINAAAQVAQTYSTGTPPIKTYVLGVGPDTGDLDAIALGGGTTTAHRATSGAAAEVANALAAIRKSTQGCDYNLPWLDGGRIDLNRVNVQIRVGIAGARQDIYHVGIAANCSDTLANPKGEGWYYDIPPPGEATKITLCPNSCLPLQATDGSDVTLLLGCTTTPPPP